MNPFTPREEEVIRLLANDYRFSEIALALGMRPATVKSHLRNIRMKVGLQTLPGLVAWYQRNIGVPDE